MKAILGPEHATGQWLGQTAKESSSRTAYSLKIAS